MKKTKILIIFLTGSVSLLAQKKKLKTDTIKTGEIKEVVVTSSYGTKKMKEEVVGSIATITSRDIITSQAYESVDRMIAGLSPGVQVVASTELAKPVAINIRGLGSAIPLNGLNVGTSTQPLIIVDGVILKEDKPIDVNFFDGGPTSATNINSLSRISTDNIESISILKDAAAVGLYGADAANGVILITTKKGKKGKARYSYNTQYGVSEAINKVKYMNSAQYLQLYNTYLKNVNPKAVNIPDSGVDVNWYDVMNKTGTYFKTNFGISGGSNHFTYRVGLEYNRNNEAKVKNYLEKKGLDFGLAFNSKKWDVAMTFAGGILDKSEPNTFYNFILAPNIPIYASDGKYSSTGYNAIPNPLAAANQNINDTKINSAISSLSVSYKILKNLKLSSLFGIDYSDKKDVDWHSGLNATGQDNGTLAVNGKNYPKYGKSKLYTGNMVKWNWSSQAYYEHNFGNHHTDVLAGIELRLSRDHQSYEAGNYFADYTHYQEPGNALLAANHSIYEVRSEEAGRSLFGQINYDFKKKYFFLANVRRDESSAFGKDKNAAINGGLGVSWNLSSEDFMKNISWINFLRLRSSWGITGNSRIGSFRSAGLYVVLHNGVAGGDYAYPDTGSPPNSNLGWEKNEKTNIGLDWTIFKNYDFTLEVFRNNISNMIETRDTPPELGYNSTQINGEDMYNQGIEFSLRATWLKRPNFLWTTGFNIAKVVNKVTYLKDLGNDYSDSSLARAQKVGASTSAIWGYEWLGVNPATGEDIYNINGIPTDANKFTNTTALWKIIGNSQPNFTGGLRNNITILKQFTLSFLVNFELGGSYILNDNSLIDKYNTLINRNMTVNALDYWTPENTDAINHRPYNGAKILANTTKYVYDNTYVKLQNVNFSYALPISTMLKPMVKTADIYIDATNVAYWYKQKSPADRNGIRELRYLYPEMRTISLGFRANF